MNQILKELLKQDKMHYRELVDITGLHPNTVRRELDSFIKQGLVREEGRENWKRGKKLWYSLTEKGKKECFRTSLNDFTQSLNVIKEITTQMLSEPLKLEEWRETGRRAIQDITGAKDLTLEKRFQQSMKKREAYFGTFRKALRDMHKISLNLAPSKVRESLSLNLAPSKTCRSLFGEVYINVTEEGIINVVSEEELLLRAPQDLVDAIHTF